jgi:hypothetical protein
MYNNPRVKVLLEGKMNNKKIAIITELIPIISAPLSILLIMSALDSKVIRSIISVTMIFGFLGFMAFLIFRKAGKEDKTVRILGIMDLLATFVVIGFYMIAFLSIGM